MESALDRGAWLPSSAERIFAAKIVEELAVRPLCGAVSHGLVETSRELVSEEEARLVPVAISCAKFFAESGRAAVSEAGRQLREAFVCLLRKVVDEPESGAGVRVSG
ncbi:hypothetical protein ACH4SP_22010 [Streptomyces sp. NPDC021093]|uniref:hypothetical protein n=1 Tax=Streptomyces sp. NPDC021093 TaxID=3365112 RepID=UPI0037A6BBED